MTSPEDHRRFYARLVTATAGVVESRIVDAFAVVRREQFLGRGPWQIKVSEGYMSTETDDPVVLYQDVVVGVVPERGLNNGEPSLHARSIGAALPRAGDVLIHAGAGTGYYTAILAHLVGPAGHVHAYEIDTELARRAADNLAGYANVRVDARSALEATLPLSDVIYVSAGVTHVPPMWLDALAIGGRLVLPLTPNEGLGCMLLITRLSDTAFAARIFSPAAFFPCIGARHDGQSQAIAAALNTRLPDEVRSLRRGTEPDHTAWCAGDGWWLSTEEPLHTGGGAHLDG